MKLELRIDWSELDAFGHVNNLAFMKYAQAARVRFFEEIGLIPLTENNEMGPILANMDCRFIRPLFYPGSVTVHTHCDTIKETSFKLIHEIYNHENVLVAVAHEIIVYYDFKRGVKRVVPDNLREIIQKIG